MGTGVVWVLVLFGGVSGPHRCGVRKQSHCWDIENLAVVRTRFFPALAVLGQAPGRRSWDHCLASPRKEIQLERLLGTSLITFPYGSKAPNVPVVDGEMKLTEHFG